MARPAPSTRADFPIFRALPLRWNDCDIYGHVNNAVHYTLFDTAVNEWLIEAGLLGAGPGVFLVAETGCSYHSELRFPGTVAAGLRIERLGSSSVLWRIGLFAEGAEEAAADGRFVHVQVQREGHRPLPLSEAQRARFAPAL